LKEKFKNELRGEKDGIINNSIIQLANKEFETKKPFYRFQNQSIELHPEWKNYFTVHSTIIKGFIYWGLVNFLQKHNPNVIGLSEKLFKPQERDLKIPKAFWRQYFIEKKSFKCIYSNTLIESDYSIDHFVPWSYVAHDKLWNLIPTTKNINSSKSNDLPDIEKYLSSFCSIQYDAFHTILNLEFKNKSSVLEDYTTFFNKELESIAQMPKLQFEQKISDVIVPMIQIASNLGFSTNWQYRA